jgi:hypothetical protein
LEVDDFFSRCAGMLVREFKRIRRITGIFSSFNYLIGKLLQSASPFYYQDFAPRCAERGYDKLLRIRWKWMIFFPAARGGWYANLRELGELRGFFLFLIL